LKKKIVPITHVEIQMFVCLFVVCFIYILLSRVSDGCAIFWMNPHPLRSCSSYHWICCLFEATKQR